MLDGNLDQQLLLKLNALAGPHPLIFDIGDNSLIRGLPISFALVALWFTDDCEKRRGRMLAGLFAACVATVISVCASFMSRSTRVRLWTQPCICTRSTSPD